jgi:hypothetical protein
MAAINRQRKRLLTRLKFARLINTLRAEITRDFIDIPRRNIEWPKPGETMYEDEYMVLTLDKVHDDGSMEVTGRYKERAALAFLRFEDIKQNTEA